MVLSQANRLDIAGRSEFNASRYDASRYDAIS